MEGVNRYKDKLEDMDVVLGMTATTWPNASNLNNSKMVQKKSFLLDEKIWDICDNLQLVSCNFIKAPSNYSAHWI